METDRKFAPGRVPFTWRKLVIAGVLACAPAMTASTSSPVAAQQAQSIDWSFETNGPGKDGSEVQLTVDSRWGPGNHSSWSNGRRIEELQGLSRAQILGPTQPVRFVLVKEAGRLDCGGTAGGGRGSGTCSFTPDVGFATFLDARRIGRPDAHQAYALTMSGIGRDLVDALDKSGFAKPSVDELTSMGIHGVTPDYVRALASLGYHLSADDLISFRIHGVKAEEIRELATIGPALQRISPSGLVSLRIHGVKPSYVREMAAIDPGLRNLTADDLVDMAIHGVTPALARAYVQSERRPIDSNALVDMAIHGVTPDYLEQLAALGYRDFTADELVNLRIHGVTPDFARRLQQSGMKRISAEQLVRLRLAGFEPN
jgi:hypothetical protein